MADALTTSLLEQGFTLIETHISRVYLRDRDVYKTKRAVELGFLDFSTLEARRLACEAEVELNRRLARDVYLGVVAIVGEPDTGLRFVPAAQAEGERVLEWAVHMERLDDAQRADVLLEQGQLSRADLQAVACLLAGFHRAARADAYTASFGELSAIEGNVNENFAQVAATIGEHLSASESQDLEAFQRSFLAARSELFARRVSEGRVRDGHGDLRLEHVYRRAADDYVVLDCIEFNERFRFADVCADLAFLAMDLRYHGRVDLAEQFVAAYACASCDYELYSLLDFYESYRAMVRAKVASILAADAEVDAHVRERAHREARRYYLLALSAARRPVQPSRLVATAGLVASGKSTLAQALGAELSAPVLVADSTRKELLGMAATEARHDAAFTGAYSEQTSQRVYATLLARARHVLRSGRSVVIDATFRSRSERAAVLELGRELGKEVLFVECRCPREVALERLASRVDGASVSDARSELYDTFLAHYEPLTELDSSSHLVLDTCEPVANNLSVLRARLI